MNDRYSSGSQLHYIDRRLEFYKRHSRKIVALCVLRLVCRYGEVRLMKHRVRSLLIILSMVFGLILFDPMNCFSVVTFADENVDFPEKIEEEIEEPEKPEVPEEAEGTVGLFGDETEDLASYATYTLDTSDYALTVSEAGKIARQYLKERKTEFVIKFQLADEDGSIVDKYREILDYAVQHTGKSDEGDYLDRSIRSYGADFNCPEYTVIYYTGGHQIVYCWEITYHMTYYSDYEQEIELNNRLKSVYSELGLSGKSDKEKIRIIHDYIINNVEYEYDSDELIKYTAYAALIYGKAVCNGYASLYYKMLLDNGVDNRIVTGTAIVSSGSGNHGWNMVKLGTKYYFVDTTWDDGLNYEYYLFGSETMSDHILWDEWADEFANRGYNVSKDRYLEDQDDCNGSHTWDDGVVTKAASCTGKGEIKYTCVKCDETKTEEIAPTGHKVVTDEAVAPTCTATGLTEGSHCSVCGAVITPQDVIPAQGHKYGGWQQDEENPDRVYKECERCHDRQYSVHRWDKGTIIITPTCVSKGVIRYKCQDCDAIITEQVDALEHKIVVDEAIEPTCEKSGLTKGSHCERCGKIFTEQEIVKKLGHNWDNGVVVKKATTEADGLKVYTCTRCGEKEEEILPQKELVNRGFKDVVDPESFYYAPVYWAYSNDITTGTGNSSFEPTNKCTREQIVTFLWRMAGEPEPEKIKRFTDMKAGAFYEKAISWAYENGITIGLNDGTGRFGIGRPCTRAMAVTFLWRAAGKPEENVVSSNKFSDVAKGSYYYKAVSWAAKYGITKGVNTKEFGIEQNCDRAMIVTFLYRYADISDWK